MLKILLFCIKMFLLSFIILFGITLYIIFYYSKGLPSYKQLKEYHPPCVTRMYSSDGILIQEYAKEYRIFIPLSSMPKFLVEAFISAEDKNYYQHPGFDIIGVLRASYYNFINITKNSNKRTEGGSTITQQVIKNFLLSSKRSFSRKIKEIILAYKISHILTKDEILELYLNQIYLGKGVYGVAAASFAYFNKSVEDLTINEAAVIASLPKAPSLFNPEKNYNRIFQRKNYVIKRMYIEGYLSEEVAKQAINEPIILNKPKQSDTINAPYYAETVREEVINMFSEEYFYSAGLTIITCLNSKIQKHATNSLITGIQQYDMTQEYRGPLQNISTDNWTENFSLFPYPKKLKNSQLALVLEITDKEIIIGLQDQTKTILSIRNSKKTKEENIASIKNILSIGDVIVVNKKNKLYYLSQIPEVEGAIIALDPTTGQVLAAEGGYDFSNNKFDRTHQAKRQTGSLIKPFVYLTAFEHGILPNAIFYDEPIELPQGPWLPMWTPKNHDNKFLGPLTLRQGLEKSRNIITIKIAQEIGIPNIVNTLEKFNITDKANNLYSIVLGSTESTLLRMTRAYGIIANKGKDIIPHYIEMIKDRKGNIIYKRDYSEYKLYQYCFIDSDTEEILPPKIPKIISNQITDEASSYQITSLLIGSIQRGTGKKLQHIPKIIAGKTGTTNNSKDTWFIGFTPQIVVGIYMGYDIPKSLGEYAYGSSTALPIFINFMSKCHHKFKSIDFELPDSIDLISINPETGKPSLEPGYILEAFKKNTYFTEDELFNNKNIDKYNPFNKINNKYY